MAKLEIDDYSSYDEYLKDFRGTHLPQARPMSKDQFERVKAKREAQNKNKPITLDKEAEDVYADASAKKNGTTVEHEKALNRAAMARDALADSVTEVTTPKKGGMQANVDDTKAIGATKEELDGMLQRGEISRAAYDEQIAALQTPEVQEEMIRGEKKADETVWDSTNREVASSVTEVTTPKKDDPPEVKNDKNNYNKAMMSIWDAYNAREIDKETAGYFTIDAIATLAKNLGRSIGNVGAQFSGGTIDNGHDESKWGQRQNALLNETIGKDTESLGGAAGRKAESENIANLEARIRAEYSPQMFDLEIKNLENEVKKSGIDVTKAENSQALIEHIKKDPNYANSPLKMLFVGFLSQTGVGGAVNTGASALEKLASLRGKK